MSTLSFDQRTVLCVDSDSQWTAELAVALTDYQMIFACNAFEALRQINTRGFHGYVLDYWLPDLAGTTLCREIRKLDPYGPIVFCTAAERPDDRARAIRAGAQAYLYKPIDAAKLKAELRSHLSAADMQSIRARVDEERAIQEELERRLNYARLRSTRAASLARASFERTARIRAMRAFIEARGTRAHFEHWWPQVFQAAQAAIDIS